MSHAYPERSPAELSRTVATDMEAAFAGFRDAGGHAAASRVQRLAPRARGGARLQTIGAVAAAALVGLAAGSLLQGAKPKAEAPAAAAPVRLAAAVAPNPVPVQPSVAAPAPIPAPVLASVPAPTPTPAAKEAPRPVKAATRPKPKPKPKVTRVRASRAEVLAADRRLRRAYASAIRAGVPRPVLVSYRNRWDRLRRTAWDEPARLVRGYGALTEDLSAEARRRS